MSPLGNCYGFTSELFPVYPRLDCCGFISLTLVLERVKSKIIAFICIKLWRKGGRTGTSFFLGHVMPSLPPISLFVVPFFHVFLFFTFTFTVSAGKMLLKKTEGFTSEPFPVYPRLDCCSFISLTLVLETSY